MKKNILIILLTFCIGFIACETTEKIDDFPLRPSQMVVNCLFTQDSAWEFQVSKSLSVLDNADLKLIDNATINLYKGDSLIDVIFRQDDDGWYRYADHRPISGEEYSIEVSSPDFEKVLRATETACSQVNISDVTVQIKDSSFYSWSSGGETFESGNMEGTLNIYFSDPEEFENYYSLSIVYFEKVLDDWEDPSQYHWETRQLLISSDDASVENADEDYFSMIFTDTYFNGQNYQLKVNFEDWQATRNKVYYIVLTPKQKAAYLYQKSIDDYYKARNDPFAEPVEIYGNIENGYGIFSSYSKTVYIFQM